MKALHTARDMDRFEFGIQSMLGLGVALATLGIARMVQHASEQAALGLVACKTTDPFSVSFWNMAMATHCWGCPAAAVGVAMIIGAATFMYAQANEDDALQTYKATANVY